MFNVGDLVTGNTLADYGITNERALMVVVNNDRDRDGSGDCIEVGVVCSDNPDGVSMVYIVGARAFEKCSISEYYNAHIIEFKIHSMIADLGAVDATKLEFERQRDKLISVSIPDMSEVTITPEEEHLMNALNKENFGTIVWSDDEIDRLASETEEMLGEFENCSNNSYDPDHEVMKTIVRKSNEEKGWIESLFSKHPNYDPKLHGIVLNEEYTRDPSPSKQKEFWDWLREHIFDTLPEDAKYDRDKIRHAKGKYNHADRVVDVLTALPNKYLGEYCGQDIHYWEKVKSENRWVNDVREVHDSYYNPVYLNEKGEGYYKLACQLLGSTARNYLKEERIDESAAGYFNFYYDLSAQAGQKTSTIIRKIAKMIGIDQYHDIRRKAWTDANTGEVRMREKDMGWNYQFTQFCDAIKPLKVKRWTILSVNPVDFYMQSIGHKWASCMTMDCTNIRGNENNYQGMSSGGCTSEVLDGCTFQMYLVDSKYTGDQFELQERIKRCKFDIGEGKLVQLRVYPDGRDGTEESGTAEQMRNICQRVIAECLEVENFWSIKRGIKACEEALIHHDGALNYPDYFHYNDCNVSYLGQPGTKKNHKKITVGKPAICIHCGEINTDSSGIECPDCRNHYIARCSRCGGGINDDDNYIYCEDNGAYYCDSDCAERDDVHYCQDDGQWHTEANCFRDDYYGDWYSGSPVVETEDNRYYMSEENARSDGYDYVAYSDAWIREDDILYTEDGKMFATAEDAENEGYVQSEDGSWVSADSLEESETVTVA